MIFDDNPHASIRILRTRMPYAPFDMRCVVRYDTAHEQCLSTDSQ